MELKLLLLVCLTVMSTVYCVKQPGIVTVINEQFFESGRLTDYDYFSLLVPRRRICLGYRLSWFNTQGLGITLLFDGIGMGCNNSP